MYVSMYTIPVSTWQVHVDAIRGKWVSSLKLQLAVFLWIPVTKLIKDFQSKSNGIWSLYSWHYTHNTTQLNQS